tara:strand:- start:5588 stop:6229 length:642 start_codon:yes stop_codon:yes gene_type:complete
MSNSIKIFEILLIGFLFPLTIIYFGLSRYILFFIWVVFFYTLFVYVIFYKSKNILFCIFQIKSNFNLNYFYLIIIRWIVLSIFLYLFTSELFPEKLFNIQKENPTVMYAVLFLYPFFSAFPQEFIFCTFFFKRYKSLFKKEYTLIFMSALIFCFAHVFFINWVAPLLSLFGGLMFATTYSKTNSLLLVSIEHALYGNTLFFIGLGWFFWGGSV